MHDTETCPNPQDTDRLTQIGGSSFRSTAPRLLCHNMYHKLLQGSYSIQNAHCKILFTLIRVISSGCTQLRTTLSMIVRATNPSTITCSTALTASPITAPYHEKIEAYLDGICSLALRQTLRPQSMSDSLSVTTFCATSLRPILHHLSSLRPLSLEMGSFSDDLLWFIDHQDPRHARSKIPQLRRCTFDQILP